MHVLVTGVSEQARRASFRWAIFAIMFPSLARSFKLNQRHLAMSEDDTKPTRDWQRTHVGEETTSDRDLH